MINGYYKMNKIHIVKKGDTLWGIANFYKKKLNDLVTLNSLYGKKKNLLKIGQEILLENNELSIISGVDTILSIKLYNLEWKPISNAKLLLEYDGKCFLEYTDDKGIIKDIYIDDALKGIKVSFYTIKNSFDIIAHHKILPLGKKSLKINSRAMVLKGRTYQKEGVQLTDTKILEKELKAASHEIKKPDQLEPNKSKNDQSPKQQMEDSQKKPEIIDQKVIESRIETGIQASIVAPLYSDANLYLHPDNEKYRKAIIAAAKKYNLTPQALAAKINAEAGVVKGSQEWNANAQASTSSAVGLTQFLTGTWYEICTAKKYRNTLVQQHVIAKKIINDFQKVIDKNKEFDVSTLSDIEKKKLKVLAPNPEFSVDAAAAYARFNIDNVNIPLIKNLESADLAKVAYIAHHDGLEGFKKIINNENIDSWNKLSGQVCSNSDPNCAKLKTYKERFTSARAAYRWWLCTEYTDAKINVNKYTLNPKKENFKDPRTSEEIIIFLGGVALTKPSKAFNSKSNDKSISSDNILIVINSLQNGVVKENLSYVVKSKYGEKPHKTDSKGNEVLKVTKGDKLDIVYDDMTVLTIVANKNNEEFKIDFPQSKSKEAQGLANSENKNSGLSFGKWQNPLRGNCQIRRFGYKSLPLTANAQKFNADNLKNATAIASRFNKTTYRNSGLHQGIDLEADKGTNIYPVCIGNIINVLTDYPGYGKTIILECDVNDLPLDKQRLISVKEGSIYFIYAHLDNISVTKGSDITEKNLNVPIGKTGNTGNAGSMKIIEEGAHLHFEVRTEVTKSLSQSGLKYRLDPFPWIENCKTIEDGVTLTR